MRRRLQSHRFRRRLLWGSVVAASALAVVGGSIVIGNTGHRDEAPLLDEPARVYREPEAMTLTRAHRRELLEASLRFVRSAVTREHVDASYDMASPSLKQGMTRREWDTGNIPVIPFPAVGLVGWRVDYAYRNDVALDLSLVADKKSDTVGKTFTIELRRYGKRWLVEAWVPNGVSGPNNVRSIHNKPLAKQRRSLGAAWLLVPLTVFAVVLLLPITLAVRHWRQGRRAVRAYEAELRGGRPT